MPRARSKDPFVAAIKSYLVPAFEPHGFKLNGKGTVMRIRNDLVQWMTVSLSRWGSKTFRAEFGTNSLFYPRDFLHLDVGGGAILIPAGKRGDKMHGFWSATTHERADKHMEEVVKLFCEQALPVLEAVTTVEGLSQELESLHHEDLQTGKDLNHHRYFERGCCAVRLQNYPQAVAMLRRAIELYDFDGRDWCGGFSNSCKEIISAIERGEAEALQTRWVTESITRLRLTEVSRN